MSTKRYPGTAIILAGGKSSRLGFDKQLLEYNGEYLMDYLLKLLEPVFQETVIVSNTPEIHRNRGCRVVSDILPEAGPLGGLHAGLMAASFETCYLTACDMPGIRESYIRYMLECQRSHPGNEAVVTRVKDMLEPMNALYSKGLALCIGSLLDDGKRKMTALLDRANTYYVPEKVALRYSPDWLMFDNINTIEDLERFHKLEQGGRTDDQGYADHAAGSWQD